MWKNNNAINNAIRFDNNTYICQEESLEALLQEGLSRNTSGTSQNETPKENSSGVTYIFQEESLEALLREGLSRNTIETSQNETPKKNISFQDISYNPDELDYMAHWFIPSNDSIVHSHQFFQYDSVITTEIVNEKFTEERLAEQSKPIATQASQAKHFRFHTQQPNDFRRQQSSASKKPGEKELTQVHEDGYKKKERPGDELQSKFTFK